jgi:hypothetical protein
VLPSSRKIYLGFESGGIASSTWPVSVGTVKKPTEAISSA